MMEVLVFTWQSRHLSFDVQRASPSRRRIELPNEDGVDSHLGLFALVARQGEHVLQQREVNVPRVVMSSADFVLIEAIQNIANEWHDDRSVDRHPRKHIDEALSICNSKQSNQIIESMVLIIKYNFTSLQWQATPNLVWT